MAIELQQGANALIPEQNVIIEIGWNAESPFDADVSAFLVDHSSLTCG